MMSFAALTYGVCACTSGASGQTPGDLVHRSTQYCGSDIRS